MKIRINVDVKVGRVVKFFIFSDLLLLFGWGFIEPVFSVFVVQRIAGATLVTVGIAAALYWTLKSFFQIPISNYLDRTPGEKDDFIALIGGLLLAGLSSFAFGWISTARGLYIVQAIHALAFALYIPSWSAIFSRHLDKNRVSFDWSLDSTAAGVAAGASGLLSGLVADAWGFSAIFIFGGILSVGAALVLIAVPDLVMPKAADVGVKLKEVPFKEVS